MTPYQVRLQKPEELLLKPLSSSSNQKAWRSHSIEQFWRSAQSFAPSLQCLNIEKENINPQNRTLSGPFGQTHISFRETESSIRKKADRNNSRVYQSLRMSGKAMTPTISPSTFKISTSRRKGFTDDKNINSSKPQFFQVKNIEVPIQSPINTFYLKSFKTAQQKTEPREEIQSQTNMYFFANKIQAKLSSGRSSVISKISNNHFTEQTKDSFSVTSTSGFFRGRSKKVEDKPDELLRTKEIEPFQNAYLIEGQIGKGSYATVYLCVDSSSKHRCAVKVYNKESLSSRTKSEIVTNEVKVLRLVNHPNVLKLIKVKETKTELHILTELISGVSLSSFSKKFANKIIPESIVKPLAKKLLKGLSYLHSINVFHRDIKLENVLITNEQEPKIIDFGFSIQAPKNLMLNLFCGTPNYMSPEIVQKKSYLGGPSDCWAFGVLLYRLMTGNFPFASKKTEDLHKRILSLDVSYPDDLCSDARRAIESVLRLDPENRATFEQLEHFKFFCS